MSSLHLLAEKQISRPLFKPAGSPFLRMRDKKPQFLTGLPDNSDLSAWHWEPLVCGRICGTDLDLMSLPVFICYATLGKLHNLSVPHTNTYLKK
jgi:hypothetical protein